MSESHDFAPWMDAVTFHLDGTPVVQQCKVVVDGVVCSRPYSDDVHRPASTEDGPVIKDGRWKGWREVGSTDGEGGLA